MDYANPVAGIVEEIRKNWEDYDFCATTLDDAWCDRITERARDGLTSEEHDALLAAVGGDEDKYHDAANEATFAILEGFVRYLAGQHRLDIQDGGDRFVECKFCHKLTNANLAHAHDGGYVGDECCWDERLRTTE